MSEAVHRLGVQVGVRRHNRITNTTSGATAKTMLKTVHHLAIHEVIQLVVGYTQATEAKKAHTHTTFNTTKLPKV